MGRFVLEWFFSPLRVEMIVDGPGQPRAHAGGIFQLVNRGLPHGAYALEPGHQGLGRFRADARQIHDGTFVEIEHIVFCLLLF